MFESKLSISVDESSNTPSYDQDDGCWFICYPGGYCYVDGEDARDIEVDELAKAGYNIDDIHVFPASAEIE